MLSHLVKIDLRARYKGSVLGFLWTFINPLMLIIVYSVVFTMFLKVNIPNYTIYLTAGLLPWNMFQNTLVGSSGSILRNSHLVSKIYFPRGVLPLSVVTSNVINYLYSMVIMIFAILIFHVHISSSVVLFPVILAIQVSLMLGCALILSSINVYFRDVEHIVTVVMMAWFYATPIVYSLDAVPESIRRWFYINPMTPIDIAYVDVLYRGAWPNLGMLLVAIIWSVCVMILGWIVFRRLSRGFGDVV
ncbi:ABC transporter permease [Alicyclobacillus suci]|uniref:ABC transporter permease n=1 Tax=Alicyclobacillus suci TaxID=2816080 RepID=UPI0034DD12EA